MRWVSRVKYAPCTILFRLLWTLNNSTNAYLRKFYSAKKQMMYFVLVFLGLAISSVALRQNRRNGDESIVGNAFDQLHLPYFDKVDVCPVWPFLTVRFPHHANKDELKPGYHSGILCFCDWVFLHYGAYGNFSVIPHYIFVENSLLSSFAPLVALIPGPFVLISVGGDTTIPLNKDLRFLERYAGFNETGGPVWNILTSHPNVIHWFCENHDTVNEKVSTLPTGFLNHGDVHTMDTEMKKFSELENEILQLASRPTLLLYMDVTRFTCVPICVVVFNHFNWCLGRVGVITCTWRVVLLRFVPPGFHTILWQM